MVIVTIILQLSKNFCDVLDHFCFIFAKQSI